MEGLFIEPGSLPGGRGWEAACSALETRIANGTVVSPAEEALRCSESPLAGLAQVFLLLCVYGAILFKASELIANGSELLLLVPSLRDIVGSVVLPILGAVPDGAIVLFSGLGPNAQETLAVGVGALAGSTSMLLTIPWFLSVLAGRVTLIGNGYRHHPKLYPPGNMSPTGTGVEPLSMVRKSGKIMLLTATSYLVIQAAAISTGTFFAADENAETTLAAAKAERGPAMLCFVTCLSFFIWYLYYQVTAPPDDIEYRETVVDELKQKAIRNGDVSLTAAFTEIRPAALEADESTGLQVEEHKRERLASLLRTFFQTYDRDSSRTIDKLELQNLMRDLGEKCSPEEITQMYKEMDLNNDGKIELDEFTSAMPKFIISRMRSGGQNTAPVLQEGEMPIQDAETGVAALEEESGHDEEEEEVPHDLRDSDPQTQIRNVLRRSFMMMTIGTALVLLFSDPMVNVMSDFGERVGIPAFYISFVLAPLASNASELLAAYSYAQKKTRKTVTISFSTLLGAAILNNTFVLSIFMLLITVKSLAWQFTAETISILFVEIAVFFISQKKIITLRDGYIVLAVYPASLALVAFLENVIGLD